MIEPNNKYEYDFIENESGFIEIYRSDGKVSSGSFRNTTQAQQALNGGCVVFVEELWL